MVGYAGSIGGCASNVAEILKLNVQQSSSKTMGRELSWHDRRHKPAPGGVLPGRERFVCWVVQVSMPYDIRNPSSSLDLPIAGQLAPGPVNKPEQIHLAYGGSTPGSYGGQQAMYVSWNTGEHLSQATTSALAICQRLQRYRSPGQFICLHPEDFFLGF